MAISNFMDIEGLTFERLLHFLPPSIKPTVLKAKRIKKGDFVYRPYQNGHKVYLVKDGRVKISLKSKTGKEYIQTIAYQDELFGESGLIQQQKTGEFAQAIDPTIIYEIPLESMKQLMKENRMVQLRVFQLMNERLYQTEKRLNDQLQQDASTRIVRWIQDLAQNHGKKIIDTNTIIIEPFFKQAEIAGLTGCSIQVVRIVLSKLKTKKWIDYNKQKLILYEVDD